MPSLKFLGEVVFDANLWHFNRHSLSYAAFIGGTCCFLPIPFQMIPAVLICVWFRCNVPATVAIVWISNPLTMPAMMYFAYQVGAWIMGVEVTIQSLDTNPEGFAGQLLQVLQPLLLGCLVCGLACGTLGFTLVRLYYRWRAARYKQRKLRNRQSNPSTRTSESRQD